LGYSGGDTAIQLEKLSDEEVIHNTMTELREVFGATLPDPIGYSTTRWGQDIYSYGAYSFMKTGSSKLDYEIMAKAINNKIFFAGEATSEKYPATTHGAYLSGIRAAEEIQVSFYIPE
jgi:monoamine oxidase